MDVNSGASFTGANEGPRKMNDLEKRYTGLDDLLYAAAALDPRFKSLPFLSDHDAERTFTGIAAEATSLYKEVNQHIVKIHITVHCVISVIVCCALMLSLDLF